MPEWLNPDLIMWLATAGLGALGIKNAGPILAFLKSLLPKDDGKPQPSPNPVPDWWPTPQPDDEPRPVIYDLVDAYTVLRDQADANGHAECRRKLDEVLHHLLTDGKDTEPAHA